MPTTPSHHAALPTAIWRARAEAHRARADRFTRPARDRSDRGLPHPVADFLFHYYPFGFAILEQWQPGIHHSIIWDDPTPSDPLPAPFNNRFYHLLDGTLTINPKSLTTKEKHRLAWINQLLIDTESHAPNFACHGLHEWAMVYQGKSVRHEKTLTLRLPQKTIDHLVESQPIRCTHHDAFRFFADQARPFNLFQPSLESRNLLEQPGCLHANMDLYKWAAKSMPWIGSDLLIDCFELAVDLRDLDMRASPYDLTDWGMTAVPIETADGRRHYESAQKSLAARARPLRERLIDTITMTLQQAG